MEFLWTMNLYKGSPVIPIITEAGFLSSTSVIVAVLMSYSKALLNKPTLWPNSESIVQPSVKAPCVIWALGRLSHVGKFACSPSLVNMAKSNLRRKGFASFLQLAVYHEEKSGPGQRLWRRNTAYWLAPSGLLSLLYYTTQDHLSSCGADHGGLGLPHQPLIKKMPHRLAHRPFDTDLFFPV